MLPNLRVNQVPWAFTQGGGARFWDFTVFVKRSVAESPKLQNDPNLLSEELDLPDMQFLRSHFVFCPVRDNDGSALQLKISLHAPTFFGISAPRS